MSKSWPVVPLGEVLTHRKEFIRISDFENYKRCRVQLHAKGIVLRDLIPGAEIKTKEQQVCRAGEFLVAEIDAKVGGFGVVPDDLDGSVVSSHYFLFQVDEEKLDRRFLNYFSRTPSFREQVAARGSTNYAAIRPQHVLQYQVPLPPLSEQRRIVARIEELAAKINEAQQFRQETTEEAEALTLAKARRTLSSVGCGVTELADWLDADREGIQTGPFGAQLGRHEFTDTGRPLLTIGNVRYDGLDTSDLKFVTESKARVLARYEVVPGDVLFARMGTVGRCCVVPDYARGWLINYHIIRVALDHSRVDPRFIHWTIHASRDIENYLNDKVRGATREGVNSSIVAHLPCRIPPLPEQGRIVEELDALQAQVDALKKLQSDTAAELEAMLPSILDKAFKGEL